MIKKDQLWVDSYISVIFHCVRSMWPGGHLDLDHKPGQLYNLMCLERESLNKFFDKDLKEAKQGINHHIDRMFDHLRNLYPEGHLDLSCKSGKIYKLMTEEREKLNAYIDTHIRRMDEEYGKTDTKSRQ